MQHFLRKIFKIFLIAIFCSCNAQTGKRVNNERVSSNIYDTESNDAEMNAAIIKAVNNMYVFDTAFKSNKYDTSTFAIKVRFPTERGSEHIWITSIEQINGQYYGIMDDIPELTKAVKQGEQIAIKKQDISDWMFADNGVLRGGYTIKVIRSRMSKEEKADFDKNFDFQIED